MELYDRSVMKLYDALLDIVIENIEGMSYEEILNYLNHDAIPSYGSVSGLIYCSETNEFACKYHDEIIELMRSYDMAPLNLNDMAWFAWETLILCHGEQVLEDLGIKKGDEDDN